MFSPSPGLWSVLIEDRQRRLRHEASRHTPASHGGVRVRIGHLLIAVGSIVGGERVEVSHERPALPHSA